MISESTDHEFINADQTQDEIEGYTINERYTINEAIEYCGFGKFQVMVFIIAGFSWAADAMEVLLIGFVMPVIAKEWELDDFVRTPLIVSSAFVVN